MRTRATRSSKTLMWLTEEVEGLVGVYLHVFSVEELPPFLVTVPHSRKGGALLCSVDREMSNRGLFDARATLYAMGVEAALDDKPIEAAFTLTRADYEGEHLDAETAAWAAQMEWVMLHGLFHTGQRIEAPGALERDESGRLHKAIFGAPYRVGDDGTPWVGEPWGWLLEFWVGYRDGTIAQSAGAPGRPLEVSNIPH